MFSEQEDGHSLINNQHDMTTSGSHVNPAFNSDGSGKQNGMELHEVSTGNYGSTTPSNKVVDTSA